MPVLQLRSRWPLCGRCERLPGPEGEIVEEIGTDPEVSPPAANAVQAAYLEFCAKLARQGLPRRPNKGPRHYAERIAKLKPELAPSVMAVIQLYIQLRYGTLGDPQAVARLRKRVAGF